MKHKKFILGGFCPGVFCLGGFFLGGLCPGGFCPRTSAVNPVNTHNSAVNRAVLSLLIPGGGLQVPLYIFAKPDRKFKLGTMINILDKNDSAQNLTLKNLIDVISYV